MRAYNHQLGHRLRSYPARARAVTLTHSRRHAGLSVVALAVTLAAVFAVMAAGWELGGVAFHMVGVTA